MLEQAVIMAGGEGQRLRPLTEQRPKPLMPLLDEPVIGYTLRLLRRHGVRNVSAAVRYRAEQLRAALGDGAAYGVRLTWSEEEEPRGTAGCVRDAAQGMRGTVLVMSGDGLTDCDLSALYEQHAASGAPATVVLKRVAEPGEYGVCILSEDGRIRRFVEKPGSDIWGNLVNTGIYFLEAEALQDIPAKGMWDFGRDLFPAMAEAGCLAGAVTTAYWCDIGNPPAYAQAQADLLMGRVGLPAGGVHRGGMILERNAKMSPSVTVSGRCYIGRHATIGRGTVLGSGTVVGEGAQVGANVRLENTCLWANARVDAGSILRNVVVVPDSANSSIQRMVHCL